MFYYIFIIIYLLTLSVLLFRKRSFDFLTVYIISLLLFNLSTFFGVVTDPYSRKYVEPNELLFFYSTIPLFIGLLFLLIKNGGSFSPCIKVPKKKNVLFLNILLVFFFVCIYDNHEAFWGYESKMLMIENLKFTSMLLLPIPSVGAVFSLKHKKYWYLFFFICCALMLFFLGSRSPLAILGLCVVVQFLSEKKILIIEHYKLGVFGVLGLLVIILGKRLYGSVLSYGPIDGLTNWLINFNMSYFAEGSEFLSTPLILNAVIEYDFSIPTSDVLGSLLAIFPVPMSFWGLSSGVFNDRFQTALFPDMNYGMAYNIWAEAYSWFDFLGVLIYAIVIPITLVWLWKIYRRNNQNAFGSLILLIGVLLSFWVHRNSLGSILGYIRNALYPMLFLIICSNSIFFIFKKNLKNIKINEKN